MSLAKFVEVKGGVNEGWHIELALVEPNPIFGRIGRVWVLQTDSAHQTGQIIVTEFHQSGFFARELALGIMAGGGPP